eukprot:Nk52_evm87s230 gene=Nk52_evmTU87s230
MAIGTTGKRAGQKRASQKGKQKQRKPKKRVAQELPENRANATEEDFSVTGEEHSVAGEDHGVWGENRSVTEIEHVTGSDKSPSEADTIAGPAVSEKKQGPRSHPRRASAIIAERLQKKIEEKRIELGLVEEENEGKELSRNDSEQSSEKKESGEPAVSEASLSAAEEKSKQKEKKIDLKEPVRKHSGKPPQRKQSNPRRAQNGTRIKQERKKSNGQKPISVGNESKHLKKTPTAETTKAAPSPLKPVKNDQNTQVAANNRKNTHHILKSSEGESSKTVVKGRTTKLSNSIATTEPNPKPKYKSNEIPSKDNSETSTTTAQPMGNNNQSSSRLTQAQKAFPQPPSDPSKKMESAREGVSGKAKLQSISETQGCDQGTQSKPAGEGKVRTSIFSSAPKKIFAEDLNVKESHKQRVLGSFRNIVSSKLIKPKKPEMQQMTLNRMSLMTSSAQLNQFQKLVKDANKNLPPIPYSEARLVEFGDSCFYGRNIEVDKKEAFEWYKLAAEYGSPVGMYKLALCYDYGHGVRQNEKEAVKWYTLSANGGCAVSNYNLGVSHFVGEGTPVNSKRALKHYKIAADNGDEEAQCHVGIMYLFGLGVAKSENFAAMYFRKASDKKYAKAMFFLAYCLENGVGVQENVKNAIKQYIAAGNEGIGEGFLAAGVLLLEGTKVQQDLSQGVKLLTVASKMNDSKACYYMGTVLEFGYGVDIDLKGAVEYYQKAANAGHIGAKAKLAVLYQDETGYEGVVTHDLTKAIRLHQIALDEKVPSSLNNLGVCYLMGKGVPEVPKEAVKLFEDAANRDFVQSYINLGYCYEHGLGVTQDITKAFEWYLKAAEKGHMDACKQVACMYEHGRGTPKSIKKSLDWYHKVAENKDAEAQYVLGNMYMQGSGVAKNESVAFVWFKLAAEAGNIHAMYNLANAYESGRGTTENVKEATQWYMKAAKCGHPQAMYQLSYCYAAGKGIDVDEDEAEKWEEAAAQAGDADAQNNRGVQFMKEENDPKLAFNLYKKAAEQGQAFGMINMGYCLISGEGVQVNEKEGFSWLSKAAKIKHHPTASYNLAVCHEHGLGTPKNTKLAFKLYNEAAESGHAHAQSNIGYFYHHGIEVAKDELEAIKWYKLAADKGVEQANFNLGEIYLFGSAKVQDSAEAIAYYRAAAVEGNTEGAFCVASLYELPGPEQDFEDAFIFYSQAANDLHSSAMCNLGLLYEQGAGCDQDFKKAFDLFKGACEKCSSPSPEAFYNYGRCFLNAINCEKNVLEGTLWLEKGAALENPPSLFALGFLYWEGAEVPKDVPKAVEYFNRAAEKNHREALNCLGLYHYQSGEFEKAFKYFKQSTDLNHLPAHCNVGLCYLHGTGVAKDWESASVWFRAAAVLKDPLGMFYVGLCYETGIGVHEDSGLAALWYGKAAQAGVPEAQYYMANMFFSGRSVPKNINASLCLYKLASSAGVKRAEKALGNFSSEVQPLDFDDIPFPGEQRTKKEKKRTVDSEPTTPLGEAKETGCCESGANTPLAGDEKVQKPQPTRPMKGPMANLKRQVTGTSPNTTTGNDKSKDSGASLLSLGSTGSKSAFAKFSKPPNGVSATTKDAESKQVQANASEIQPVQVQKEFVSAAENNGKDDESKALPTPEIDDDKPESLESFFDN